MARYCTHCGNALADGVLFCTYCGTRVSSAQQGMPTGQQAYSSPMNDQNTTQQAWQQAAGVAASPTQLVKRAWDDLLSEKNWIPTMLIWSLVMCVPILNFFAIAAALKWGTKAATGNGKALPKLFEEKAFAMGFFALVISLVWGIVGAIVASVPVVGVVALVFMTPMLQLCVLRYALYGKLGNGFELGKMWEVFKKDIGGVLAVYWIPMLFAVAVSVVAGVVASLFGGASVLSISGAISGYAPVLLSGLGILGGLVTLVACFASIVASLVADVVATRALGYYLAQNAPSWVRESASVRTLY